MTLTKSGWLVDEADLEVNAGATSMATYRLRMDAHKGGSHGTGSVALRGMEAGTRAFLDGQRVADPSLPQPLNAGSHVVTVATASAKVTRTFTVYPDTTTDVLLTDPPQEERSSGIVAPAEEYLPDHTYSLSGKRVFVRYAGHEVTGTIGASTMRLDGTIVTFDAVPSRINGRLYLPLALLTRLTAAKAK